MEDKIIEVLCTIKRRCQKCECTACEFNNYNNIHAHDKCMFGITMPAEWDTDRWLTCSRCKYYNTEGCYLYGHSVSSEDSCSNFVYKKEGE